MNRNTNCEDRTGKTCGDCEHFDGLNDDCLKRLGLKFETTGADEACIAFHPSAVHVRQCLACGSPADIDHCGH